MPQTRQRTLKHERRCSGESTRAWLATSSQVLATRCRPVYRWTCCIAAGCAELACTQVCVLVVLWTQEGSRLNAGEESGMENDIFLAWRQVRMLLILGVAPRLENMIRSYLCEATNSDSAKGLETRAAESTEVTVFYGSPRPHCIHHSHLGPQLPGLRQRAALQLVVFARDGSPAPCDCGCGGPRRGGARRRCRRGSSRVKFGPGALSSAQNHGRG